MVALGLETSLRAVQIVLLQNPDIGDVEPGTGGLRKVRLSDPTRGKGKRGGARVHYLWLPDRGRIYLIYVYGKNESSGLTPEQRKQMRAVVVLIKQSNNKE